MRFVQSGKISDVSQAVRCMFDHIIPRLRGPTMRDPNTFRAECAYTEHTDQASRADS